MTPLQIDLVRVSMERMRPMPLLRSRCIDVSSPVAVRVSLFLATVWSWLAHGGSYDPQLAVFKRKLVRDRSTYHEIDTTTMEMLLSRGANVNSVTDVRAPARGPTLYAYHCGSPLETLGWRDDAPVGCGGRTDQAHGNPASLWRRPALHGLQGPQCAGHRGRARLQRHRGAAAGARPHACGPGWSTCLWESEPDAAEIP